LAYFVVSSKIKRNEVFVSTFSSLLFPSLSTQHLKECLTGPVVFVPDYFLLSLLVLEGLQICLIQLLQWTLNPLKGCTNLLQSISLCGPELLSQ